MEAKQKAKELENTGTTIESMKQYYTKDVATAMMVSSLVSRLKKGGSNNTKAKKKRKKKGKKTHRK